MLSAAFAKPFFPDVVLLAPRILGCKVLDQTRMETEPYIPLLKESHDQSAQFKAAKKILSNENCSKFKAAKKILTIFGKESKSQLLQSKASHFGFTILNEKDSTWRTKNC